MTGWKPAAAAAALVAIAGAGGAIAPVVHGQKRSSQDADMRQLVQVYTGHGGRLGITIRDVEESDASRNKLASPSGGVVVDEVTEDSPAEKGGLKKGDVIVEFDGERIRGSQQFRRIVQETPSGRKVQAIVMRDAQRVTLTLEPRESGGVDWFGDFDGLRDYARTFVVPAPARPAPAPVPPTPPASPTPPTPPVPPRFFDFEGLLGGTSSRLGITVDDLSSQLAEYFGAKDGVLVKSVTADSVAAKAGLRAGDVITSVNGTDVTSPSDLRRRLGRLTDSEELTIGIVRDRKPMTLKGKLEPTATRRRVVYTVL